MAWAYLGAAILAELIGTIGLRVVAGTVTWWAVALIATAYALSFVAMTVSLRRLNLAVVYAVWSGVGIAAVALAGAVFFGERLGWRAVAGLLIITAGVLVLVTSGTTSRTG